MPNGSAAKGLRGRLTDSAEQRLGQALSDLLDNPLLTGAIGRAFDARERAAQAQELAMGALNIPSAADVERLTRRLRSISQRLEGIEDGVHRLEHAQSTAAIEARLEAIERRLETLGGQLDRQASARAQTKPKPASAKGTASRRRASAG